MSTIPLRLQVATGSVTLPDSPSPAQSSGPLFVVGIWRSGTSLLYALLNKHPQIALLYEGDLPLFWPFFLMPGGKANWLARWEFWYGAIRRHRLDVAKISPGITDRKTATEAVYREYARQRGSAIWGDKSPNYYDSLPRLQRDFPDARFIILWRSPAGICRSIIRAAEGSPWFAKRGMIRRGLLGCREMKSGCDQIIARGAPVHQIWYEDLIHKPQETMKGICDFLQIPFEPGMASLQDADRSAIASGEHHALVKGGSIVSSEQRPEVLSPQLKKKIDRYVSLWREEYGGTWPVFPGAENVDPGKLSAWERFSDRFVYRCLRIVDWLVVFIYGLAPLRVLKEYRSVKEQHTKREKSPSYQ